MGCFRDSSFFLENYILYPLYTAEGANHWVNSKDRNSPSCWKTTNHSRGSCFITSRMTSGPHRLKKTSNMQSKRRDLHHTWLHHETNEKLSFYCYSPQWITTTFSTKSFRFVFAFIHGFWLFLSKYFEGEKRDFQLIYQYKYRSNFGNFKSFHGSDWFSFYGSQNELLSHREPASSNAVSTFLVLKVFWLPVLCYESNSDYCTSSNWMILLHHIRAYVLRLASDSF